MKLYKAIIVLVLALLLAVGSLGVLGCEEKNEAVSRGTEVLSKANDLYDQTYYSRAEDLYWQAVSLLENEGNSECVKQAREKAQNCELFLEDYPYDEDEVKKLLTKNFPDVPKSQREWWITSGDLESMEIDRAPHYFQDVVPNLKFRNLDLMRADQQVMEGYAKLVSTFVNDYMAGDGAPTYQQYVRPASYRGESALKIPRKKLPDTGVLKLWWPIPILTGPQTQASVVSITPDSYVRQPPQDDADIGLTYMEVDLEELEGDLDIAVTYDFTHYEQRFQVDPDNVGTYDPGDDDYERYTASNGNISITPEIRETAEKVAGDEDNPYLAARKIYDYVVDKIDYSFTPHECLWPRGEPESVYVHTNKRGDCGAQSMYFCALARAVGIPARCTGGYQLLTGDFSDHFWAEFFLPNYGWVPVDTSVAQLADFPTGITDEERKAFKNFFFANQDCFRCVVQKDVDVPLIPPAQETVALPVAIQMPAALCNTMRGVPGLLVEEYWTLKATQLSGPSLVKQG